ncbi:MAG TPA: glycosyltransferase, partial [Aggregatilineales bacterium]|nr:glycosyltransferase [Aggregatilineales bacterium]
MDSHTPLLSIVIPAYNEAAPDRLPSSLKQITAFVATQPYAIEVIIVNNNSTDDTLKIAESIATEYDYIHVLTETIQGKG